MFASRRRSATPARRSLFRGCLFSAGFLLMLALGFGAGLWWMQRPASTPVGSLSTTTQPAATPHPGTQTPTPKVTPMRTIAPLSQAAVDAAYDLVLEPRMPEHLPAEIYLLPAHHRLELQASVTRRGELPGGLRERSRRLEWSASSGTVVTTAPLTASFTPPPFSRPASITAELILELEAPEFPGQVVTARRQAALRLLTASPGSELRDGMIDGYQLGHYLDPLNRKTWGHFNVTSAWPEKYPQRFAVPSAFYRVDSEVKDLLVSPNLPLGTFIIDFPWKSLGMPQYIALDYNLVRKLEDLMALMRAEGLQVSRFVPIYGFRPPQFNLGTIEDHPDSNLKEPFSMHQYGRALDFIIDEDADGLIDDLDHDGAHDINDAVVMMHFVNKLDRQYRIEGRMDLVGGAGLYERNDFVERNAFFGKTTAYIHVDVRGFVRDNGTLVRWPDVWPGTKEAIPWGKI